MMDFDFVYGIRVDTRGKTNRKYDSLARRADSRRFAVDFSHLSTPNKILPELEPHQHHVTPIYIKQIPIPSFFEDIGIPYFHPRPLFVHFVDFGDFSVGDGGGLYMCPH